MSQWGFIDFKNIEVQRLGLSFNDRQWGAEIKFYTFVIKKMITLWLIIMCRSYVTEISVYTSEKSRKVDIEEIL